MKTKQVIVVRNDLNMRKGKIAAQASHASIAFLTKHLTRSVSRGQEWGYVPLDDEVADWLENSFRKICVYVESEQELLKIHTQAMAAGLDSNLITDNGDTEFGGVPTRTCLAIGPHEDFKIDKITGHLKLL